MTSIAWPDMFSGVRTKTVSNKEATAQNLKLIIQSGLNSLYGDPGYGNNLQEIIFASNNFVLSDIVKETVLNCIHHYIPQLIVGTNDVKTILYQNKLYILIRAFNKLTHNLDIYDIDLLSLGEGENALL